MSFAVAGGEDQNVFQDSLGFGMFGGTCFCMSHSFRSKEWDERKLVPPTMYSRGRITRWAESLMDICLRQSKLRRR
jgi:hypothetical protein